MTQSRSLIARRCLVVLALTVLPLARSRRDAPAEVSRRGPGRSPRPFPACACLFAPRFDLSHVQPKHFAAALGNDPERIFEFVRDGIGYEVYQGCLRGPRGTLVAMSGNSVDRAALLASLLQHAGGRVRYARGTLPELATTELVTTMWSEQPEPTPPKPAAPSAQRQPLDSLPAAIDRDYSAIRAGLSGLLGGSPSDTAYWLKPLVGGGQEPLLGAMEQSRAPG